jgi:hypothetical protein
VFASFVSLWLVYWQLEFYPLTAPSSEFFTPSRVSRGNELLKSLYLRLAKPVRRTLADASILFDLALYSQAD